MSDHRIEQQLSAYLDGELTASEMDAVRRHVEGSEALRRTLGELRATKALLGRLQTPELPRNFVPELWARIDRPRALGFFNWIPRPLVGAVAVLIVILLATPLFLGHQYRLRAAEVSPDLFIRAAAQAAAEDPYMDRAYLGLVSTDANLRLIGEEARGRTR